MHKTTIFCISKPITMEIYTDSCDDLLGDIKPFMA